MDRMDYFLQIYGTLPRAGPGSNDLTRKALEMMSDVPESPRILDVGCGPGMQTVELLKITSGVVVALDLLPDMISRVEAGARRAGVSDRLKTLEMDMIDTEKRHLEARDLKDECIRELRGAQNKLEKHLMNQPERKTYCVARLQKWTLKLDYAMNAYMNSRRPFTLCRELWSKT